MPYVRSNRRKKIIKRNVKVMVIISGICFVTAFFISVMVEKLPSLIEKTVSMQIESEIERTLANDMNVEDLKKNYKRHMKQ